MAHLTIKHIDVGTTIPRVIHQTIASTRSLPKVLAINVENLRQLNPDWEVRLYDDRECLAYIEENFGTSIAGVYRRIDSGYGAAKADFFRYLLIYNEGGCYLDIKSSMTFPLSRVLNQDDKYILSQWPNGPGEEFEGWGLLPELSDIPGGEYQQWHIISVPGHPFLRAVIQRLLSNIAQYDPRPERMGVGLWGVLKTTGPIPYTREIAKIRSQHAHRVVDSHKDMGLIYSVFQDPHAGHHPSLKSRHYSQLKHPIVGLSWRQHAIWALYRMRRRLVVGLRHTPS